jgi:methylmalonyl-CoA/ethylmalonyl-CoA epimerase
LPAEEVGPRAVRLLGGMLDRLDHVGVVVAELEPAIALYERSFGTRLVHRETAEEQGVEAALLALGDGYVELLRPLHPRTTLGRFLERQGPGLHHVAYEVPEIETELARVAAEGVRLIDHTPRRGIRDTRVAFLNPRSTGGVLIELVEHA